MGPHNQVKVRSRFWEGITQDDFYIFQREETRHSEVPLLANYTTGSLERTLCELARMCGRLFPTRPREPAPQVSQR